jgi:ubiquinone/menaquinone biosynthesis C-methylase UbiE
MYNIYMKITDILNIPWVWKLFRKTIDLFFGLYRKRMKIMRNFGLTDQTSVVDIACGTGEYSKITNDKYLGVDLDCRYIADAQKQYNSPNKKFVCADANKAEVGSGEFEAAILIDATHHLSDTENSQLLKTMGRVASKMVILCDPIQQSRGNLWGRFLTHLDRGNYIRPKDELLNLVGGTLNIEKIVDMKMMGIESVCILARPRK